MNQAEERKWREDPYEKPPALRSKVREKKKSLRSFEGFSVFQTPHYYKTVLNNDIIISVHVLFLCKDVHQYWLRNAETFIH